MGLKVPRRAVIEAAFERAAGALGLFDFDDTGEPRLVEQCLGVREQAVEAEPAQPLARAVSRLRFVVVVGAFIGGLLGELFVIA